MPNLDGTFEKIPLGQPKLRTGAIPTIFPGYSFNYSVPSVPIQCLSLDVKEEEQFTKTIQASRTSQMAEENICHVETLKD